MGLKSLDDEVRRWTESTPSHMKDDAFIEELQEKMVKRKELSKQIELMKRDLGRTEGTISPAEMIERIRKSSGQRKVGFVVRKNKKISKEKLVEYFGKFGTVVDV